MNKVYTFPDRNAIEEEAAAWLVRLDNDKPLEPNELEALREWLCRSPMHYETLSSFTEFWGNQSLVALPIPLETLLYNASQKFSEGVTSWRAWFEKPRALTSLVSALVILITTLVFSSIWLLDRVPFHNHITGTELYATAIGQRREVTLPDGTIVNLNTNSQIKMEYDEHYRNILLLQGEAHFAVAKMKDWPLRVYAGRSRVQAVGTAFIVYLNDDKDVNVTVTEGKVALGVMRNASVQPPKEEVEKITAINNADKSGQRIKTDKHDVVISVVKDAKDYLAMTVEELAILEASQEMTIPNAQASTSSKTEWSREVKTITPQIIAQKSAWREGLLVFQGNSLEKVVEEISRYTTLSIEIIDSDLRKIRIGGSFSATNIDALFDALEVNFGLKVTRLDYNRVLISSSSIGNE